MNIKYRVLATIICMVISLHSFSQKYKTASDTPRLNVELVKLSNEVAELTSKLTIAKNNLPGYHTKADKAASNAEETAQQSSDQADKATNGNVSDARNAKKKARRAYKDAEHSSSAKNNINEQEKKIDKLAFQLNSKQQKLRELEQMRDAIRLL
jgi:hypothetical protein